MTATAERYVRATRSSHLRMREEPGDVDTLAAAGMAREGLGISLLRLRAQYDATARPAADSSLTEHLLILMSLSGLSATSEMLGRYAVQQAEKRRVVATPRELRVVVGRVLDVFLDAACRPCAGVGHTGGYGAPVLRCKVCRETGLRQIQWQEVAHLEEFGRWLKDKMSSMMDNAEREIRLLLRDPH